jgi:hypothetical protein
MSTYLFTRKMGAKFAGGLLAAICFCFGSAFANIGYHMAMLRALSWFPLALLFIERYMDTDDRKWMLFFSIVISFQILSGSTQMAFYSVFFYFLYILYAAGSRGSSLWNASGFFLVSCIPPAVLFLPQLFLTIPVIEQSNRISSLDFALWGSLNPVSLITAVFPSAFRLKGHITTEDIYTGTLSLLFLITALKTIKWEKKLLPLVMVMLFSFLMALGMFNPIYVFAVRALRFYFFRAPSRFLFFGIFSVSVLSGIGFDMFFAQKYHSRESILKLFRRVLYGAVIIVFSSAVLIKGARRHILNIGQAVVEAFIHGAEYHRYSIYDYYRKVERIYSSLAEDLSFTGPVMLFAGGFAVLAIVYSALLSGGRISMRKKKVRFVSKALALLIISANLWGYRYSPGSFVENTGGFSDIEPVRHNLFGKVRAASLQGYRLCPVDIRSGKLPAWAIPNVNMLFDIDSIGAYSPLSGREYYSILAPFQVVDDSIGLKSPDKEEVLDNLRLLRVLNVKYILSPFRLEDAGLEHVITEKGLYLYGIKDSLGKGFLVEGLKTFPVSDANVRVLEYEAGYARFQVNTPEDMYFVFSEYYFPGWKAEVDGEEVAILPYKEILQSVRLQRGRHNISFTFSPFRHDLQ